MTDPRRILKIHLGTEGGGGFWRKDSMVFREMEGVSEGRGYRSSLTEYKGGELWKINCQSAAKEGKGDPEYITEPYGWDQVYFIVTQPNPLTLLHPSRVPCFITLLTKVVFLPVLAQRATF